MFDGTISMPDGGWIAARVLGPHSKYIGDDYAFAHTSPVYVVRDGRKFVKADDVQFLAQTSMRSGRASSDRAGSRTLERDRFRAAVDSARAVYRRLAE